MTHPSSSFMVELQTSGSTVGMYSTCPQFGNLGHLICEAVWDIHLNLVYINPHRTRAYQLGIGVVCFMLELF